MKNKKVVYGSVIVAVAGAIAGGLIMRKNSKGAPKGAVPVQPFEAEKYMGDWYEVARMSNHFEKNLINTTAHYELQDDGSVKVINRGYHSRTNSMKEAIGKAKFTASSSIGKLKVSFFYPFYAAYNVIAIDPAYKFALVAGKDLNYLWILSRENGIPEEIRRDYLKLAHQLGYNISKLIWVEHNV